MDDKQETYGAVGGELIAKWGNAVRVVGAEKRYGFFDDILPLIDVILSALTAAAGACRSQQKLDDKVAARRLRQGTPGVRRKIAETVAEAGILRCDGSDGRPCQACHTTADAIVEASRRLSVEDVEASFRQSGEIVAEDLKYDML